MKKVELLSPAGNLEKMKYAIHYGADAVYAGVPDFSLRVRINNFNKDTIKEAAEYAHEHKKKIYITLNIYAHNRHLAEAEKHLKFLKTLGIDGVIVSDPGIIMLVKKHLPKVEIHLSTQANATNWQAVKFWQAQGVKRVILAREVTLEEIKEIKKKVPKMQLEYFVHGAMCMSYSGRCILSKWMTNRSANLGDCTQPCRWAYKESVGIGSLQRRDPIPTEMSVVDDKKRYQMDVEEDQHGTYFFNSYDMNLLDHIDKLIEAGVDSLKIEGRAKSIYYLSTVVKAYRQAIDFYNKSKNKKTAFAKASAVKAGQKELNNLVHRGYSTGFLLGTEPAHNFDAHNFKSDYKFVGEVEGIKGKLNVVFVHNEIFKKDKIEAVTPEKNIPLKIKKIFNSKMEEVKDAHGGHEKRYFFEFDKILPEKALLRSKLLK
ncbi:MAG TPA: hypothetical protein DIT25_03745 [Candidatus Moranbacteria bacterium]|nr:hypothetical protein [Candidatus Moranbacteria bacterium]